MNPTTEATFWAWLGHLATMFLAGAIISGPCWMFMGYTLGKGKKEKQSKAKVIARTDAEEADLEHQREPERGPFRLREMGGDE